MRRITLLLAWFAATSAHGMTEADLLPAEKAFAYEARANADAVVLDWDVAEGYYLYQKRFAFESQTPGVILGEPVFPEGETHEDEFLGRQTVFRHRFTVSLPYTREAGAPDTLQLKLALQGCADIGLCYPPQKWTASLRLPAPVVGKPGPNLLSLVAGGPVGDEFLPADEAFVMYAEAAGPGWAEISWQIAEGYYLYRKQLAFSSPAPGVNLGEPVLPTGETEVDEYFGESEIYRRELVARLPVQAPPGAVPLVVRYQGCAEDGICYPPITRQVTVSLPAAGGPVAGVGSAAGGPVSEQDRLAGLIVDSGLGWVVAAFFGFGLLLAFTPCVLPMVPILSAIIVGPGRDLGTRRAFLLSAMFVLAMALTYTVAGVIVAELGQNLQATFQHPLILGLFAAVFVALALAMFGFYEFQVPAALQARLSSASQRQQGGTLLGAGVMGMLSALIVGPCVAAPLAAALIVIGQSGDALRGGLALFSLSLGMGAPLLAFGTSAGKLLPKAGPWMAAVNKAFGILLLGVAVWMIERIVPAAMALALWAALALLAGVLILGGLRAGQGTTLRWLGRAAGIAALAYGSLLAVGAATGGEDPLRPLAGSSLAGEPAAGLDFQRIKTVADLDAALAAAAADGRPAMLDFYADWCVDCKKMERHSFIDPAVRSALDGVLLLKADVTANDEADQALLARFGIFGPPTIAFFDTRGAERRGFRQVGFAPPGEFAPHVRAFREALSQ